jgi:hypothetical protein
MGADAIVALAVFLALPAAVLALVWVARRRRPRADARLVARVAELEATVAEIGRWADTVEDRLRDDNRRLYGVP